VIAPSVPFDGEQNAGRLTAIHFDEGFLYCIQRDCSAQMIAEANIREFRTRLRMSSDFLGYIVNFALAVPAWNGAPYRDFVAVRDWLATMVRTLAKVGQINPIVRLE